MTETFWLPLCGFLAGLAGGGLYFGGLWLTVTRLAGADRPYRLLALSFALRMAALLALFYLLLPLGWTALAAAMAGLLLVRQLLLRSQSGGKGRQWRSVQMQPSSGSGE